MARDTPKTTRCTYCRAEFTDAEIAGAQACPACGSTGVPAAIAEDVTVDTNWHDLRILVMWAENWEQHCINNPASNWTARPGVVAAIAKSLERFRPAGAAALTLIGELRELPEQAGVDRVDLVDAGGKTHTFKKPTEQ